MTLVWSLNYHEVTQDPRVLKQARALSAAGNHVRVLCEANETLPAREIIDGVDVRRFAWSDYTALTREDSNQFAFAKEAFDYFKPEFDRLVEAVEKIRAIIARHPGLESELTDPRNLKNYYRDACGADRETRKIAYRKRRLARSARAIISNHHRSLRAALKQIERQHQIARRAFWDLHQGRAFVFAANVLRLAQDDAPEVIHAHDIYTLVGGVLLARKHDAKLVYDAHELETARASNMGPKGSEVVAKLEALCFSDVDALITVSKSIAEDYASRYAKADPVVIMNAPELDMGERPRPNKIDVRKAAGLGADVPIVVFTGGIQRGHRGVDKVLEAITYLPDVHLVTLGARHERNDAWFTETAEKLGVRDRVHMLDPVDARDVVTAISTATVSVIPFQAVSLNHEYAMPNKLFEAAFARVPLVVSDLKEMRRFVEDLGIGRTMDQTDPKSIAAALDEVIQDPSKFAGTADIGQKLNDMYSWQAQTRKLAALYQDLMQH